MYCSFIVHINLIYCWLNGEMMNLFFQKKIIEITIRDNKVFFF